MSAKLLIIDVLSKFLIFIYPYWYAILLQLAWQFLTEIKKSYPFLHFLSPKNASEIQALYSHQIGMQGVDSHKETYEVQETSQENAQQESTEIEQAAVSEYKYLIFNIIKTQRSAGSNAGRFLRLI